VRAVSDRAHSHACLAAVPAGTVLTAKCAFTATLAEPARQQEARAASQEARLRETG
jgi:hypothetical protein